MSPKELLAAVRAAQNVPSNYALARVTGIAERSLQRWNVGSHTPDDATAARLAELAGLDPDATVAAMHAQRAAEPAERSRWERIARRLQSAGAAAAAVFLSLLIGGTPDAGASVREGGASVSASPHTPPLYIM